MPKKHWIQGATSENKGSLRRTAGVGKGETIPAAKLAQLAKEPGVTGKRARLAQNIAKVRHK